MHVFFGILLQINARKAQILHSSLEFYVCGESQALSEKPL